MRRSDDVQCSMNIYTGNGNLIPIAFRIEYESIFNKEIRKKGRAWSGGGRRREMQIHQYILFSVLCPCVGVCERACCVLLVSKVCLDVCVANENKCASVQHKV